MSFMSSYIESVLKVQLKQTDPQYIAKVEVLENVVTEKRIALAQVIQEITAPMTAQQRANSKRIDKLKAKPHNTTALRTQLERENAELEDEKNRLKALIQPKKR